MGLRTLLGLKAPYAERIGEEGVNWPETPVNFDEAFTFEPLTTEFVQAELCPYITGCAPLKTSSNAGANYWCDARRYLLIRLENGDMKYIQTIDAAHFRAMIDALSAWHELYAGGPLRIGWMRPDIAKPFIDIGLGHLLEK